MATITVIIVNYCTADLALAAVESVFERDHGTHKVDVHLLDNASPGDDADRMRQAIADRGWSDRVTFYPERENHGFGRGNNIVLGALAAQPAAPEFVFLLNPDARLKTNTIAELANFLNTHPEAAVVGAGVDRPSDGTPVVSAFRFPSAISEFESAARFGPISRMTRHWIVSLPSDTPTQEVDWVVGAAMLVRFSTLKKTGFFDPDFFLYFEETELMHRIRGAGWQIWFCPEARVEHIAGVATKLYAGYREPLPEYWFDSWRFYFSKTHSQWGARLCALSRFSGSLLHLMICKVRGHAPAQPDRFPRDFYLLAVRPLFGNMHRDG